MIIAMHGQTTRYCNIRTDIRLARETGYDALEINSDKLIRYLRMGYLAKDYFLSFKLTIFFLLALMMLKILQLKIGI